MQNNKPTILFVCTDWYEIGGSSASLIDMIQALGDRINPIVLLNAEGRVSEHMRQLGVHILIQPFFYLWDRPKPIKTVLHHPTRSTFYRYITLNYRCATIVADMLKGKTIDIVHSNSSITTIGVGLAKRLGAKHIWHIREFLDLDFGLSVYGGRNRLRHLINKADARICVSSSVSIHWKLTPLHTHVLWDAVIDDTIVINQARSKEPFFLFCAANITERKGANIAVKAFCLSKLSSHGYRLKLVGHCDDKYKDQLLAMASLFGDNNSIDFIEYTDNITDYFAKATAFLMCSMCEALGRVTIQAMINFCPVIAHNAGGTIDFIRHNETGLLFNTDEECATLMCDITNQDYSKTTYNAFSFAVKNFSFTTYSDKLFRIYQSLCQ